MPPRKHPKPAKKHARSAATKHAKPAKKQPKKVQKKRETPAQKDAKRKAFMSDLDKTTEGFRVLADQSAVIARESLKLARHHKSALKKAGYI